MSHPTPRGNSNNVIIWFPFQALCIFIYAKEFSKPSNWHSNRKTSFRAQVYKQTKSFCAWKLIPHNSKLLAARWTGRRGRESAHLSGRGSRWWSPLLTFQQSQKQTLSPGTVSFQPQGTFRFIKSRRITLWMFLFCDPERKEGREETEESSGVLNSVVRAQQV